jgi:hypothetical protein
VEEGQYRGEAILPFTRVGDEIALAYAREPGITVWERVDDHRTIAGLHLEGLYAHLQEYLTVERRYRLVNRTEQEQIVTVEQPRGDGDLVDTRPPDERTSSSHRWRVSCAPQAETEIAVFERQLISSRYSVLDVQLDLLARWLDGRFLDPETRRELQGLLRDRQAIEVLDRQMEHLRAERDDLARRQDRLRQNLGITPGDDVEAEIRRRSAEEFRRTQDRESEIGAEMSRLSEERAALQRRFEVDLAGLGSDD